MNTTNAIQTLPASESNTSQRRLEARMETARKGVYLSVITTHTNGAYWSRLDRVKIEDGVLTMKIDRARFQDLPPVSQRSQATKRYSAKALQEAHEDFRATVEYHLANALDWAERY